MFNIIRLFKYFKHFFFNFNDHIQFLTRYISITTILDYQPRQETIFHGKFQILSRFLENVFNKSMNNVLFYTFQHSFVVDDRKYCRIFSNNSALTIFSGCSALMKSIKKRLSEVVCLSHWLSCQIEHRMDAFTIHCSIYRHVIWKFLPERTSTALCVSNGFGSMWNNTNWFIGFKLLFGIRDMKFTSMKCDPMLDSSTYFIMIVQLAYECLDMKIVGNALFFKLNSTHYFLSIFSTSTIIK